MSGTAVAWVVAVAAGVLVLGASIVGARRTAIHAAELRVFSFVNGWPGSLFPWLWLPMQFGNLVVGMIAGVVVTLAAGEPGATLGVLVAVVLKLVTERVLRHEMAAHFLVRQRPGTSAPGAILRGDVPVAGPSFPSGHALLAAAVACVVAAVLTPAAAVVAFAVAIAVAVGRVYVGAHLPLDVTAGTGAGVVVGAVVALVVA